MRDPQSRLPSPDIVSFNTVLACYLTARNKESLWSLFEEMQRKGESASETRLPRPHSGRKDAASLARGRGDDKIAIGLGSPPQGEGKDAAVGQRHAADGDQWAHGDGVALEAEGAIQRRPRSAPAPQPSLKTYQTVFASLGRGSLEESEEDVERALYLWKCMRDGLFGAPEPTAQVLCEVIRVLGR